MTLTISAVRTPFDKWELIFLVIWTIRIITMIIIIIIIMNGIVFFLFDAVCIPSSFLAEWI